MISYIDMRDELVDDVSGIRPQSRVTTEYPELTKNYFARLGIPVQLFHSYGASEAKVPDLMDVVVDLTETGTTLRKNGLKIIRAQDHRTDYGVLYGYHREQGELGRPAEAKGDRGDKDAAVWGNRSAEQGAPGNECAGCIDGKDCCCPPGDEETNREPAARDRLLQYRDGRSQEHGQPADPTTQGVRCG